MISNKKFITITVRSFIATSNKRPNYDFGKPINFSLPKNSSALVLAQKILGQEIDQLGFLAVNGKVAPVNTILAKGDFIDLFAHIAGG